MKEYNKNKEKKKGREIPASGASASFNVKN